MFLFIFFILQCSVIFPWFYVTLFYLISFTSTFRSCALFPCPSIICSHPFNVPTCHVQNLTDRILGMRDCCHHGDHTLYVWILWKKTYTQIQKHFLSCSCHFPYIFVHIPLMFFSFPASLLSLPSMFLSFPSMIFWFYVHIIEISLLSFCFFMSFWCSSDFLFRSSHVPSHFLFMSFSFYGNRQN